MPEARPLTDEEIARLAAITERDRVEALAFWRSHATPLIAALLQVEDRRRTP